MLAQFDFMAASSSGVWHAPVGWVDPSGHPSLPDEVTYNDDLLLGFNFDSDDDHWGEDGETWLGESLDEEVSVEEAEQHATDILMSKYHNGGRMYATDICKLCYWLKKAGLSFSVAALAKKPGLHTSNYNRHVKHVLGMDQEDETLQHLSVPVSDVVDGSRSEYLLPVIHPHELLNKEFSESPELKTKLATHVRENKLPPLYTDHPVAIS